MYESIKILTARQNHGRLLVPDCAQPTRESALTAASPRVLAFGTRGYPSLAAMECFGSAMVELLECNRCFVTSIPRNDNSAPEQVRIGYTAANQIPAEVIARIAHKLPSDGAILASTKSDDSLARSVIGSDNAQSMRSIMGRLASDDGGDVVFVAGWRAFPLLPVDITWLSRAVRVIWTTAARLIHPRLERRDLQTLLEELVFPAFIVDENLRLHDVNSSGRKLLMKGEPLRTDGGLLVGLNSSVTDCLKEAIRNALTSRPDERWTNTTVTLSTEHQQFAFAWVGAVPARHDTSRMLVIVPRVDEAAGAKRIAAAFGLNCAEERIIARILHGQCPRRIGADLGLTEATVRTYTKRIMLKLGINRQSELFLLYILTLSPFGAGQPETSVSRATPYDRLNGRTAIHTKAVQ